MILYKKVEIFNLLVYISVHYSGARLRANIYVLTIIPGCFDYQRFMKFTLNSFIHKAK